MKLIPRLLLSLLALPLPALAAAPDAPPSERVEVGASIAQGPPLTVVDLKGNEVDLRADLAAGTDERRMTLMVFWGTWCQPCVEEIPVLNELKRYYGGKGLRILGVGLDLGGDSPEKLTEAISRHGITYPVLFDAKSVARKRFGLSALPAAALVDGTGHLVWLGRKLPQDLSSRIRGALIPGGEGEAK